MFRLENTEYWVFEKTIPEKVCDAIMDIGDAQALQQGVIAEGLNADFRNSSISWIEPTSWITGLCNHYFNIANMEAGWRVSLSYTSAPQYTIYEEGMFYNFHTDSEDRSQCGEDGTQRKLSLSIQLNDPSEYEGGELRFQHHGTDETFSEPQFAHKGSVIVFPSYLRHKVTKVTKGTRKSLVAWCRGPEWQ